MSCRPPTPFFPFKGQHWQPSPPAANEDILPVGLETQWHGDTASDSTDGACSLDNAALGPLLRAGETTGIDQPLSDVCTMIDILKRRQDAFAKDILRHLNRLSLDDETQRAKVHTSSAELECLAEQLESLVVSLERRSFGSALGAARKVVVKDLIKVLQQWIE